MNYELCKYQKEWAIYCKSSCCYILFGTKTELKKRLLDLNSHLDNLWTRV